MSPSLSKLHASELPLLPRLALALWLAEMRLRSMGVKRTLALMSEAPGGSQTESSPPRQQELQDARRMAWLVQGVARRLPGSPRCLAQSLVLRRLLARRGLQSQLIIGVRREEDAFDAHAWVEYDGKPLQPEPPTHRPIAAL